MFFFFFEGSQRSLVRENKTYEIFKNTELLKTVPVEISDYKVNDFHNKWINWVLYVGNIGRWWVYFEAYK